MEIAFELLFQFLGELIIQVVGEMLVELGFRSMADTVRHPRSPLVSTIGFVLWGGLVGGLSLLILPHSPIDDPLLRKINLVATPVLAGAIMMLLGKLRQKRGQHLVRIDRFGYAFTFAFSMALVRFVFAA